MCMCVCVGHSCVCVCQCVYMGVCHLLIGVMSLCQYISLQPGEAALLVSTLADPHVQQVGVDGRGVNLQQPAFHGLG